MCRFVFSLCWYIWQKQHDKPISLPSSRREGNDADIAAGNLFVDHPLIQQCIPNVSTPDNPMHIADMMDWLHTGWRLRCQFIEPSKRLDFGGTLITSNTLRTHKGQLRLSDADLDPSNKQSYDGMLKVCTQA